MSAYASAVMRRRQSLSVGGGEACMYSNDWAYTLVFRRLLPATMRPKVPVVAPARVAARPERGLVPPMLRVSYVPQACRHF
jgi:hypothetical protein